MKTRPILMNGEMVRATLDDRKTQTRRMVEPQPQPNGGQWRHPVRPFEMPDGRWRWVLAATGVGVGEPFECPMGVAGDLLYVRETWADVNSYDGPAIAYRADGAIRSWREFSETYGPDYGAGPSMDYDAYPGEYVMWSNDLLAGGPEHNWRPSIHMPKWASRITLEITGVRIERLQCITNADALKEGCVAGERASESDAFHNLWTSIYGPDSWGDNPWVWAVEFKRIEADE